VSALTAYLDTCIISGLARRDLPEEDLETISITDESCPAPHPHQGTGELQQTQEIDRFLLVADQEAATF
jgi:hypothetical protein